MEPETIQSDVTTEQNVSQDTSLAERKLPVIGLRKSSSAQQTADDEEKAKAKKEKRPMSQQQIIQKRKEELFDSDKAPLKDSEYYEKEIEHLRSCILQIHELRALLKGFPSVSDVNDAVTQKKKEKGKKYVDKYMKKWAEFSGKNPNIGCWYEETVYGNIDNAYLEQLQQIYDSDVFDIMALHGICDIANQSKILPFRANIYSRLEKYKQDRDMARFIKQSGILATIGIGEKPVYSFRVGNQIIYGYLDSDNKFCTFKNKDELIAGDEKISERQKKKLGKIYDEEVEKIQALGDLESRLDKSGLMDKINLETITAYMNFNENEFEKQAEVYRTITAAGMTSEKPSAQGYGGVFEREGQLGKLIKDNILTVAEQGVGKAPLALNAIDGRTISIYDLETMVRNPSSILNAPADKKPEFQFSIDIAHLNDASLLLDNINKGKNWEDLGDKVRLIQSDGEPMDVPKADIFKGLCVNGGMGLLKCPVEALSIIKNCFEVRKMAKQIAHTRQIGDSGFLSDQVSQIIDAIAFGTNNIALKTLSAGASAVGNTSKILASTGLMSLGTMSDFVSVTGKVTGAVNIATGAINMGVGIKDIAKGAHDVKRAETAKKELDKFQGKDTSQNSRFLNGVKIAAQQKRAQGILNTVTGAAEITAGVLSLIPSGTAQMVGTGITLANVAVKFLGKFLISKYFKGKKKDKAWADILGFKSREEYQSLEKRVGKENFRRVLRRRTGVTTRQSYADALNITDAIDIFTMAKLHSGKADTKNEDEQLVQKTLSGAGYSNPAKYKDLKLKDILAKVDAADGWKAVLKNSITDKKSREKSEDIA